MMRCGMSQSIVCPNLNDVIDHPTQQNLSILDKVHFPSTLY